MNTRIGAFIICIVVICCVSSGCKRNRQPEETHIESVWTNPSETETLETEFIIEEGDFLFDAEITTEEAISLPKETIHTEEIVTLPTESIPTADNKSEGNEVSPTIADQVPTETRLEESVETVFPSEADRTVPDISDFVPSENEGEGDPL